MIRAVRLEFRKMHRLRTGLILVLNVIAVAALHEMSCVILPEELRMDEGALSKAREEGIAVISSPLSAYALCARMAEAGIPA